MQQAISASDLPCSEMQLAKADVASAATSTSVRQTVVRWPDITFDFCANVETLSNFTSLHSLSRIYLVIQGSNCSSFCSLAAIVSALRRVLNFPMRTRYTTGVPLAGAST